MQITINGTPKEIAALVAAIQEPREELMEGMPFKNQSSNDTKEVSGELFIHRTPNPNYMQVTQAESVNRQNALSVDKLADSILSAINMSIAHPRQKSIHDNTEA